MAVNFNDGSPFTAAKMLYSPAAGSMRSESRRATPSFPVTAANVVDFVPPTEKVTVNPEIGTLSGPVTILTAGGSFDKLPASPNIVLRLTAAMVARLKSGAGGPDASRPELHACAACRTSKNTTCERVIVAVFMSISHQKEVDFKIERAYLLQGHLDLVNLGQATQPEIIFRS